MSELDDLLSQLKTEYTGKKEPQPITQPPVIPSPSVTPKPTVSSVDHLLAELKGETKENKPQPTSPKKIPSHSRFTTPVEPSIFQDLRSEYQEKDQIAARQKQQEIQEKQRLEEQRQEKKREALKEKALIWLKQLNPKSDEGKWFEEFSYSYDSKIEAAMQYLEALRESGTNI
ncbi:hypothetical protein C7H19_09445 [Aphanothece hegewaldii CCALA 016]|uniref:Uncharacterized protein n=1 Tax=Aphanothece hegewaldii CCALA 016 TaxID=2107694 RepID=A0A2T1LZC2_9CHRO|nr:hypothetical protein [Aphanothece hegewaldii]PSF37759.1 hypothetical protein C7H19_09445 [Aphanothece hegewaldii CCALA 016]